ncbi:hypothetical protein GCM10007231_05590 [Nocardioides daphniae]|uniref:DNA-binding protein n=1 Tax=Nocardioides daphniae TaxID=402297 RepID=A0ABQ1Q1W2_9ACTN|nr:hypothetical protein GCM10007231_05590 [Nocardioides daphniae]
MDVVGTGEAAHLLGVSTSRVLARIADGTLPAQRVGSFWVLDRVDVVAARRLSAPGRRLATWSAWALVAAAEGFATSRELRSAGERYRARARWRSVQAQVRDGSLDTDKSQSWLRRNLSARAGRLTCSGAAGDVVGVRTDTALSTSGWSSPLARITAPGDVEAYVAADEADAVARRRGEAPTQLRPTRRSRLR